MEILYMRYDLMLLILVLCTMISMGLNLPVAQGGMWGGWSLYISTPKVLDGKWMPPV